MPDSEVPMSEVPMAVVPMIRPSFAAEVSENGSGGNQAGQ
jgi:hypothetical protein